MTVSQIASMVIDRSSVLLDMLTSLLERDANIFFEVQHPPIARFASQQQRLLEDEGSMLLRNAKATKAASEALYRACGSLTNRGCTIDHRQFGEQGQSKLEMNLLATESRPWATEDVGSFVMRYHLVLTSPNIDVEFEVLVEGPLHAEPPWQTPTAADFAEACRRTQITAQCYFKARLDIDSQIANVFRLSSPPEPLKPWETKSIHLSGLLGAIQDMTSFQASGQFPYSERLNLAFKVAECVLLLIGTPLVSSNDRRNVQHLSDPLWKTKQRFIFEVTGTENEHLANIEPHVFKIGKLLAEIATGMSVKHIATCNGPNGPELDLVISVQLEENQEMRAMPAVEVEQRVRQAMGMSYSKAVAFCLQQSSQARKGELGPLA